MALLTEFICLLIISTIVADEGFYDKQTEMCCEGNIVEPPVIDHFEIECCGIEAYNNSIELCCNGTIHKVSDITQMCCGNKLYDRMTELCCNGTLYVNPGTDDKCCGNVTVDGIQQTCLNDQIVDVKKDDRSAHMMGACGIDKDNYTPYDKTKFECCGTSLHKIKDHFSCCGEEYYDIFTTGCCGKHTYNGTIERCCDRDDYNSIGQPITPTIVPLEGREPDKVYSCCNLKLYDDDCQICCEDGVHDAGENAYRKVCCGHEVMDITKESCVNGEVKPRAPNEDYCVEELYNKNEKFCFNETQLIPYGEDEYVCKYNGQKFNFTYQKCTKKGVKTMSIDEFNKYKYNYCEK